MKIFLLNKKGLLVYLTLLTLALGVVFLNSGESTAVSGIVQEKLLPIYSVDKGEEKICALTFDAAWDDSDTDRLIEILNKYDAKATFFMVGTWAEKYSVSVKKFAEAGMEIANHSNTHPHINNLSEQKIAEEIKSCDDKIENITGIRPTLFRGPYGEYNNNVINAAETSGHKVIQWDVDSLDWKEISSEEIAERVLSRVKSGSIMLFHNGVKNTPDALEVILKKLKEDGYKVVSVSDMIYNDNYIIDHSGKQIKK